MRIATLLFLVAFSHACAGCNRTDPKLDFTAHIDGKVPATATLKHSGAQYAGIDSSYGFEFSVEDNSLLNQLIAEWTLVKSDRPAGAGFFRFANHAWWPSDEELLDIPTVYFRSDEDMEEYWTVWSDRMTGRLFVEHGRCTVGKTVLLYDLRCIDDLAAMLNDHGDWMLLGSKDEKQEAKPDTVEHWARSTENPIGGWYGLKKNFRGRFAMYIPPLMEHLGLAEVEHNARDNRMRYKMK